MQLSTTMPATWSCGSTAMPPTSPLPKDACLLLGTISSVPSLHPCPQQQLPTLPLTIMRPVLASTAAAKLGELFLNAKHACPLYIALHELGHPPFRQTTLLPLALAMTTSNITGQSQLSCISIGSATASARANITYFGNPSPPTKQITSPSITRISIIKPCVQHISMHLPMLLNVSNLMTLTIALVRVCLWPANQVWSVAKSYSHTASTGCTEQSTQHTG